MRRAFVLLCAVVLPAAAQNTNDPRDRLGYGKSDWEIEQEKRDFKEGEIKLPPVPKAESLIEFQPTAATSFRFFIDGASLSVEPGGIVRYTLVARSPNGLDNVSYEGIRCNTNSVRIYAYNHGGAWSRSDSDWKPIEPKTVQRWHNELRNRYFCPLGGAIDNKAEGLNALRRGGHPLAKGTGNSDRY